MNAPNCPAPTSIPVERVRSVADDLLLTAEDLASVEPENPAGLIRSAITEFARRLGVLLDGAGGRRESTFPPEYEATGELTLASQMDRNAEDLADSKVVVCDNVCEHGDHPAPSGQRFCSSECEACETTFQCAECRGTATDGDDVCPHVAESGCAGACNPASSDAEDLADKLDLEQRAHAQTREALVNASRELEHLRSVGLAAGVVLSVCDTVTTIKQQPERLKQLDDALSNLRTVLAGGALAGPTRETIANLIMLAALRAGAQGRDFNAYEAATLVEAWFLGTPGQPKASSRLESDSRCQAWLQQWTDGRVAEREAELRSAAAPFLQLARDRLARRSWEPISDADCQRLLNAFNVDVPEVDRG